MDRELRIRLLLEAGDRFSKPLRDLAAGGRQADAALKGARDRLREIEAVRGNVAAFRALKTDSLATARALEAAQAKVAALARAAAEVERPTRAMTRELERAKREARGLAETHDDELRRLQQLRSALREAGVATRELARHDRELRAAAGEASRALEGQVTRAEKAAERQQRLTAARGRFQAIQGTAGNIAGAGAGAIGSGMALGAPLWEGVKAAQAYESKMTDIAQKADIGRAQAAKMGAELLTAARQANQLPEAMQEGVDTLAGFGLDPRQATKMMQPIGKAATAYKAEIGDLAKAAYSAHDNLKIPVEQTGRMIDAMAQAGKAGAFEIKDMARFFPSLTAAYQGLGQTGVRAGADLAAALQITRKGAGDAHASATNLNNILQKISSPETIKKFGKMGVDLPAALKKAYQEGKTPIEALAEITERTLKGDLSRIGYLFQDAQVQQGLRPLIQNLGLYRDIRAQANKAARDGNVTDRDFAERMRDSAEASKALGVQGKILAVNLGSMLLPAATALIGKLAAVTSWVGAAAERHPRLAKAAALVAGGLALLLVGFGAVALGVAGILGPIAVANAGLIALGVAGGVASVGLLPIIGTVAAVVAGVALLAGAAYLLYANWGKITGFFAGLWQGIRRVFARGIAWLGEVAASALRPVHAILRGIEVLRHRFVSAGLDLMKGLVRGILAGAGQLLGLVGKIAGQVGARFAAVLGIHSPSRVFAALGAHVMAGLDRGLSEGSALPLRRVRQVAGALTGGFAAGAALAAPALPAAAERVVPAVARAAAVIERGADARGALRPRACAPGTVAVARERAPGRAVGSASAAPVVIHVHAAPGQSERSIAEEVARALEAYRRREAAHARASYRDDPDGADR